MIQKLLSSDPHGPCQLREHYEIEKALADRLRKATKEERTRLYACLYDELFRRVPRLTQHPSPAWHQAHTANQLKLLRPFLNKDATFLEIGPGDCSLAFAVAKQVRTVYAADVSAEITQKQRVQPENFKLVLYSGSSIPLPPGSVDVAYSHQLVEHLHPDDLPDHLRSIWAALKPEGVYLCITPSRLNGPHDISRFFDPVASGFHLQEYTCRELHCLFRTAGFSRIVAYIGGRGWYLPIPLTTVLWVEKLISIMPERLRRALACNPVGRGILGIRLLGRKPCRGA